MKGRNWEQKKIKKKKTPHCLASRIFSGTAALFGTLGSAVPPIKYELLETLGPKIMLPISDLV